MHTILCQSSVFTCSECFFHLGNSQSRLTNNPTILLFNCARLKVFTLYIAVSYLLIKGYLLTFSSWFNVRRHLSSAFLAETRVPWRNKHFSFFLGRTCDHFSLVALCFLFYQYYYYQLNVAGVLLHRTIFREIEKRSKNFTMMSLKLPHETMIVFVTLFHRLVRNAEIGFSATRLTRGQPVDPAVD